MAALNNSPLSLHNTGEIEFGVRKAETGDYAFAKGRFEFFAHKAYLIFEGANNQFNLTDVNPAFLKIRDLAQEDSKGLFYVHQDGKHLEEVNSFERELVKRVIIHLILPPGVSLEAEEDRKANILWTGLITRIGYVCRKAFSKMRGDISSFVVRSGDTIYDVTNYLNNSKHMNLHDIEYLKIAERKIPEPAEEKMEISEERRGVQEKRGLEESEMTGSAQSPGISETASKKRKSA